MKLNRGFTLAETLVTLAIIGFIASICLPGLLRSAPNKEQIMLKKAFFIAGRNINELINDEELYPERNNTNTTGFSNVSITDQTADGREATYHGQQYSGNSKFCSLFAAKMNVRGNINCNRARTLDQGGNFQSSDGIVWVLPINNFNSGNANSRQSIQVDVNGNSGRNCFEGNGCTIPDRFTIFVDRYGRLTVPDGIEQEYLTRTTTNTSYQDIINGAIR